MYVTGASDNNFEAKKWNKEMMPICRFTCTGNGWGLLERWS